MARFSVPDPVHEITQGDSIPIITFSHHKGGTGKTTSCLNIAGFLQKAQKKVLVVDCDPQANATIGLGISPESAKKNMYDVFMSSVEGFPRVTVPDIITATAPGIDCAPAHLDLVGAEPYLYRLSDRALILKSALTGIKDRYDYTLVDTPPSMGQFVINGLVAADRIIVTLDSGSFAIHGVATLNAIFSDIKEILGRDITVDMAIVTRWGELPEPTGQTLPAPEATSLLYRFLEILFGKTHMPLQEQKTADQKRKEEQERLDVMLYEIRQLFMAVHTVPYSTKIYEAQRRGLPISHYDAGCDAGRAYRAITDEVLKWT
jgi:chromosome partitioning protein